MELNTLTIIIGAAGLITGGLISWIVVSSRYKRKQRETEQKAGSIIKEAEITAENIKKDKILEAKEKFLKMFLGPGNSSNAYFLNPASEY